MTDYRKRIYKEYASPHAGCPITVRISESAYVKIIHKEGRDIIKEPKQKFNDVYQNYENLLKKGRRLNQEIHRINHTEAVNFKDEPL